MVQAGCRTIGFTAPRGDRQLTQRRIDSSPRIAILVDGNGTLNLHGIEIPQNTLTDSCIRHHIRKLSLFGSILRPDFRDDSDVDVLVEFEPDLSPGLLGIARMEREISGMLGGRKVDLRTPNDLSRYFRPEVVSSSKEIAF